MSEPWLFNQLKMSTQDDLTWDEVFGAKPSAVQTIQELNRYPFVEIGHCWRCGEYYKLTQLRLPPAS